MKTFLTLLLFLTLFQFSASAQDVSDAEMTEEQRQYIAWSKEIWDSLIPITGEISIDAANATLDVPEEFYFLSAKDAETVLVDVWGNPPGQNVLGMLFPKGYTPFDSDAWAVTLEYEEDGYISDADAGDINYEDLLMQMREETRVASIERVNQGYEAIELIGWAAKPYYDAPSNKLYWAKEIKFGSSELNTLNYNIRVLGRKGVLVLNFIAGIHQLPMINHNLDTVLALADFNSGAQYDDFDPDIDNVAAYGLGALVAGKVIAKTGFLTVAILFFKKFGVFIVIALGALGKKLLFGKKKALETDA